MADKNYTIRISTTADNSGTNAAGKAAEDAGKKITQANEESGHSFLHAESSARAFHQLLHGLTEESPLLGLALRAALSPQSAAIMAVAVGLRMMTQAEDEAKQKAQETAESLGKGFGSMEGPMEAAISAAHEATAAYDQWAAHLGQDFNGTQKALNAEIAALKADTTATHELIEAQQKAALARLDLAKAQGQITPELYEMRKADIEASAEQSGKKVDRAATQAEIAKREQALAKTQAEAQAAKDAAAAAQAAITGEAGQKADAAQKRLEAQAEEAKRRADEARGKIPAAQGKAAEAALALQYPGPVTQMENWPALGLMKGAGTIWREQEAATAETDVAKLAHERDEEAKIAKKSAEAARELKEAREAEARALEENKKKADALTESIKAQQEALARLKAEFEAREKLRPDIESADSQARANAAKAAMLGQKGPLGQLEQAADVLAAGEAARKGVNPVKGPTPQQAAAMGAEDRLSPAVKDLVMLVGQWQDKHARDFAAAAAAIRAKEGTTDGQVALLESIVSHQQQLVGRVDALSQQLAALARIPFSQ